MDPQWETFPNTARYGDYLSTGANRRGRSYRSARGSEVLILSRDRQGVVVNNYVGHHTSEASPQAREMWRTPRGALLSLKDDQAARCYTDE